VSVNRLRKQKIRMRERVRELRASIEAKKAAPEAAAPKA
jgi:chaperonin cofactor prefoldin